MNKGISGLADDNVLRLYNNIRDQVSFDRTLGSRHRLTGITARQQAERLRDELNRRRLQFSPIDWDR
jgi:hypothetical protein